MKMISEKIINSSVSISFVLILSVFTRLASAQVEQSLISKATLVKYPVAELNNCKNRADCANFCENPDNMASCLSYAEKQSLLSEDDLRKSKLVVEKIASGKTPGGCKTRQECEIFCSGRAVNIKECVAFGEELGVIPEKDLKEAKQVIKALEGGAKLPGSCTDKESCDNYCSDPSHMGECLNFAEKAGFMSPEDITEARKVSSFIQSGETPGSCKTKDECAAYCDEADHFDECLNFAEKAGLASKEEIDMARKTGGIGPGGCRSKEECNRYCEDQSHIDECISFGEEKGIIKPEEIDSLKNAVEKIKTGLLGIDPDARAEVESCLSGSLGSDTYTKLMAKTIKPTKDMGDKIQSCFEVAMKNYTEKIKEKMMRESKGLIPGNTGEPNRGYRTIPTGEGSTPTSRGEDSGPETVNQTNTDCSLFVNLPSCDLITDQIGAEACRKCK